jgi:hypothetical protein
MWPSTLSDIVQVFGRRSCESIPALGQAASEKRHRTNPLARESAARGAVQAGRIALIN